MALAARLLGTSAIRPWTFCEVSRTTSIDCLLPPGVVLAQRQMRQSLGADLSVYVLDNDKGQGPWELVVEVPERLDESLVFGLEQIAVESAGEFT